MRKVVDEGAVEEVGREGEEAAEKGVCGRRVLPIYVCHAICKELSPFRMVVIRKYVGHLQDLACEPDVGRAKMGLLPNTVFANARTGPATTSSGRSGKEQ